MFAILMPAGASPLVATLITYQRRARKRGLAPPLRISVFDFCSQIDLGGMLLLCGGLAMLLLPMTLTQRTPGQWATPWVGAVMGLGVL